MEALIGKADVHLGPSDFSARVSLISGAIPPSAFDSSDSIDLGWTLYDLKSAGQSTPRFFRALLRQGIMEIPSDEDVDLAS